MAHVLVVLTEQQALAPEMSRLAERGEVVHVAPNHEQRILVSSGKSGGPIPESLSPPKPGARLA